jgi:hypothetical protein
MGKKDGYSVAGVYFVGVGEEKEASGAAAPGSGIKWAAKWVEKGIF